MSNFCLQYFNKMFKIFKIFFFKYFKKYFKKFQKYISKKCNKHILDILYILELRCVT